MDADVVEDGVAGAGVGLGVGAAAALDVVEVLVPVLVAVLDEPLDGAVVAPLPPLGGSTETPPEDDVDVLAPPAVALDVLVPVVAVPEGVEVLEGVVVEGVEVEGDVVVALEEEPLVLGAVDGDVAGVVWAGGVLVRVFCPTGKNEPPVISVAMMPAITATRAIPISRSGQLRRNQSMIPF